MHSSDTHPDRHISLKAEDENGDKIKGGHVTEDPSKQTVSFPHVAVYIPRNAHLT